MFLDKASTIQDINGINSALKAIEPKVQAVMGRNGDTLRLVLTSALILSEETAIDAAIADFVDHDPSQDIPYIYDLVKAGASKHFQSIDYKNELVQSLIPKRTTTQGEVTLVEWFQSLDGSNNPINKVLDVAVVYTRDATGFALYRTTTRTWYNRDGSANLDTKVTTKYYFVNSVDQIKEGKRRRKLLVDSIQIPVLGKVMEVLIPLGYSDTACLLKGRQFMDDYELDFNKFVNNSSTITDAASPDFGMKTIRVKFRDEADVNHIEWLDKSPASLGGTTTIRQYLLTEFDI